MVRSACEDLRGVTDQSRENLCQTKCPEPILCSFLFAKFQRLLTTEPTTPPRITRPCNVYCHQSMQRLRLSPSFSRSIHISPLSFRLSSRHDYRSLVTLPIAVLSTSIVSRYLQTALRCSAQHHYHQGNTSASQQPQNDYPVHASNAAATSQIAQHIPKTRPPMQASIANHLTHPCETLSRYIN